MIFSLIILFVVSRFGRPRPTRADFYTADRGFTGPQNGLALFGTFMMMTSFVAASDEIALFGFDGVLSTACLALSWLVALLLVAEPVRNIGGYTFGDMLSVRMRQRPVRLATAAVTFVVFFSFMTIQLVAASRLLAQLLHLPGPLGQGLVIVAICGLAAATVHSGGMRATTWTQIINAVLLFGAVVVLAATLLIHRRFDVSTLLSERVLTPGARSGGDRLEFVNHMMVTVLGYAALPYLFIRYLAVPDAARARKSVSWAIWLTTPFYLLVVLIGFGAAAMSVPGQHLSAVPHLAAELGGWPLVALIASVVFTTVIAVTSGLATSATASFTRDIHASAGKPLGEASEVTMARRVVVILCLVQIGFAVPLMNQDLTFLLSLDITLVASSILPSLLYSWLWRGFNTAGALWSVYGGAAAAVAVAIASPAIAGLVSIPVGFLLGYLGARSSPERDDAKFAEMQVRALTGAGPRMAARNPPYRSPVAAKAMGRNRSMVSRVSRDGSP